MTNLIELDCNYEKFTRFTCGLFKDTFDWNNCVLAGGSIYKIYSGCDEDSVIWKQSDIDLFIIAENDEKRQDKLNYLLDYFKPTVFMVHNSVYNLYFKGINRVLQIICSNYINTELLLKNFDYSHLQMLYNGNSFLVDMKAFNHLKNNETVYNDNYFSPFRVKKTCLTKLNIVFDIQDTNLKKGVESITDDFDENRFIQEELINKIFYVPTNVNDNEYKESIIRFLEVKYDIPIFYILYILNNKTYKIKWTDFNESIFYSDINTKNYFVYWLYNKNFINEIVKKICYYIVFNRLDLLKLFYINIFTYKNTLYTEIFGHYADTFKNYINNQEIIDWICDINPTLVNIYKNVIKKKELKYTKFLTLNDYYIKYESVIIFLSKILNNLKENSKFYLVNDYKFEDIDLLNEYIDKHYNIIKTKYFSLFNNSINYTIKGFANLYKYKSKVQNEIEKVVSRLLLNINLEKFGGELFKIKNAHGRFICNSGNVNRMNGFMDIDFIKSIYSKIDLKTEKYYRFEEDLKFGCKSGNMEIIKYLIDYSEKNKLLENNRVITNNKIIFQNNLFNYSCDSGNLKIVKFIIQKFNIDVYNLYLNMPCLQYFQNINTYNDYNNYNRCMCVFCSTIYNKQYHILNYILKEFPELIDIFKDIYSFHYEEWDAYNKISLWWKNILYNPRTKIGKKRLELEYEELL